MVVIGENFCSNNLHPFFDSNQTWYNANPSLSICFRRTALIWFPCTIFWCLLPFEICWIRMRKSKMEFTTRRWLFYVQLVTLVLVNLAALGRIINQKIRDHKVFQFDGLSVAITISHVILMLTLICLTVFFFYQRKYSVVSYGIQWWTFLCLCISSIFEIVSDIILLRQSDESGKVDLVDFGISIALFTLYFVSFIAFSIPLISIDPKERTWPEYLTSFPRQLCFCWLNSILLKGYKTKLELKDIWTVPPSESAEIARQKFQQNLDKERKARGNLLLTRWSIIKIIIQSFWTTLLATALLRFVYDMFIFFAPLIVIEDEQWHGYTYVLILFTALLIRSWSAQHHSSLMYKLGIRVNAAVISSVYRKALCMTHESRKDISAGEIVNLMSVDSGRFIDVAHTVHILWTAPIQLAIGLYLLYHYVGVSFLSGIGVFAVIFGLNFWVSNVFTQIQEVQMTKKDARLKMLTEVLNGMRVIKLQAWELAFQKEVETIRIEEIKLLRKLGYWNSIVEIAWSCTIILACLAILGTYLALSDDKILTADNAFLLLTVFNVMQAPLTFLPYTIHHVLMLSVSLKRFSKFFSTPEIVPYVEVDKSEFAIKFCNASFAWEKTSGDVLSGLNLNVKRGKLIAIVGPVGSGKSSLLYALSGEMSKKAGSVFVNGSVAYVPQQAWIQNATIRGNVLFDQKLDAVRYAETVDACALRPDFRLFASDDLTEIGERGVNLSGGQKQRISMARAVYQNCDIYLLDDPLSALDAHVGKHIFKEVIGPDGLLKDKTRMLVTHSLSVLPFCDLVIVMKNGRFQEVGTYRELLKSGGTFAEFVEQFFQRISEEELEDLDAATVSSFSGSFRLLYEKKLKSLKERKTSLREKSQKSTKKLSSPTPIQSGLTAQALGRQTSEEEMKAERVPCSIYALYIKSSGLSFYAFVIFLLFSKASYLFASIWLETWTDKNYHYSFGLGIYGLCAVLVVVFTALYAAALVFFSTQAARTLHDTLLTRIFRAPISFFDTTPIGRILNRFGKDMNTVDVQIPSAINEVVSFVAMFLESILAVLYATPIYILPFIPMVLIYLAVLKFYVTSCRQFRRLEAITRAPIQNHFQESVQGVSLIRAYRQEARFCRRSDELVDINSSPHLVLLVSSSWLGIILDLIGAAMVGVAALLAVFYRSSLQAGEIGLSLSFALVLTELLHWGVHEIGVLETEIVALERIKEYVDIPSEADWTNTFLEQLKTWPQNGVVEFRNYSTRYRAGLPLVIKNLNCSIKKEEKIGVVGRTGAGKSSLTAALFRLVEPASGKIFIDNVDISLLGLHNLRKRLTIIPQDPVLFSGTLRSNIDPFREHSDQELWQVLQLSHLNAFVSISPNVLSLEISEGGSNLSIGQRQLICLARALLRKSKVLILDEATAAVDLETDALIQETIRRQFKQCTVITVAHRLNTIMDSERIMVMDKGTLVEFNSPNVLMNNPASLFAQMAKDANIRIAK